LIRSGEGGLQQLPRTFPGIATFEDGAACYEDIRAGANYARNCVVMDAAIHFNAELQTAGFPDFHQQFYFSQARTDESLATKTWIHAHDQNVVNQRKYLIEGLDRCGRIYYYAGLASMGGD
jgi:hypothetical protein